MRQDGVDAVMGRGPDTELRERQTDTQECSSPERTFQAPLQLTRAWLPPSASSQSLVLPQPYPDLIRSTSHPIWIPSDHLIHVGVPILQSDCSACPPTLEGLIWSFWCLIPDDHICSVPSRTQTCHCLCPLYNLGLVILCALSHKDLIWSLCSSVLHSVYTWSHPLLCPTRTQTSHSDSPSCVLKRPGHTLQFCPCRDLI